MAGGVLAGTVGFSFGNIRLHTLCFVVGYAHKEADTTYGKIGVKVWIYKGEILPEKKTEGGSKNGSHTKKN